MVLKCLDYKIWFLFILIFILGGSCGMEGQPFLEIDNRQVRMDFAESRENPRSFRDWICDHVSAIPFPYIFSKNFLA